jgi:TRAP-type C4-dicarboxylate transport system permease small subunit
MGQITRTLRRGLDALYLTGGYVSALFLLAILSLIVLQMAARWTGMVVPGAADYAGYCMAGASFMGFAYALNEGAHIRVALMLQFMGRYRRWGEVWCFGVGTVATVWLFWYAQKGARTSFRFGDISQGQDATPLWIPQSVMVVGAALLAICFIDNLVRVLFTGTSGVKADISDHAQSE